MDLGLVWSPSAIAAAVVGGLGMGIFVLGSVATDARYTSGIATPHQVAQLVTVVTFVGGLVFFVGQATATWAEHDPNWPRVVSRFGVWCAYAVALGAGTWLRLGWAAARRRRRVLARARQELGTINGGDR